MENPSLTSCIMTEIASVALEASVFKTFDYQIPEELKPHIKKGVHVEVLVRGKPRRGFIVNIKKEAEVSKVLPISKITTPNPILTDELFDLALWISKYYVVPLGKVLKTFLPAGVRNNTKEKTQYFVMRAKSKEILRKNCAELRIKAPLQAKVLDVMLTVKKGILHSELLEKSKAPASSIKSLVEKGLICLSATTERSQLFQHEYFITKPKQLKEEQKDALDKVVQSIDSNTFQTHLLFGITGSGKTEVYLQAIEHAIRNKKGVIMLVPEIALTEQTIERFRSRFKETISVLHHRLSDGERRANWENIINGESPIAIGARSAIFCPMPNLGLIIVDEEHEHSYKQTDESPSYQARDVAVLRGKLNQATVILGSATPSLESYQNAISGKYELSKLTIRPEKNQELPQALVVDMRREYEKAKGFTLFSDLLLNKIEDRKKKGEQTILFLNRRGYHTTLSCLCCGVPVSCDHCSTKMTFHIGNQKLLCHLCGKEIHPPLKCPSCHAQSMMKYSGIGTEKVEAMLRGIFPTLKTLRLDADTTRHKGSLDTIIQGFRSGKADLLIGTQMVAKGLHFPEVTLVGVLNPDATLNIPDFRSQELLFQLITQVAGRAGRGVTPGEVVIQTSNPEENTILYATKQDYEAFFKDEIETRKKYGFPPFTRIVKIMFSGKSEENVYNSISNFHTEICKYLSSSYTCHPVVASGHAKVKDFFRFQFLIRGPSVSPIRGAIEQVDKKFLLPSSISRHIDVDPSSTYF